LQYQCELSTLLVRLASSYLQTIAISLQRSIFRYDPVAEGKSNETVTLFNESLHQFDHFLSSSDESHISGTLIIRIFDYFESHLHTTEYAVGANNILEILSAIALHDKSMLLSRLHDLSWAQLHTVYLHIEADEYTERFPCPFAITLLRRRSCIMSQQSSLRIVDRIITKLLQCRNCSDAYFLHLHLGIIRHWGTLIVSPSGIPYLLQHLSTLVTNMNDVLDSLHVSAKNTAKEFEKHGFEMKIVRERKSTAVSRVIGLEAATFPDVFETIFYLAVATAGMFSFDQDGGGTKERRSGDTSGSPYQHFLDCFGIIQNLIETYKANIQLFPNKIATMMSLASKELLVITVYQLHYCVEWRMHQPIPDKTRPSLHRDVGSIHYLKQLLDRTLYHVVAPILSLCDTWLTFPGVNVMNKSRSLSLRVAVEKATLKIKDISQSHNMSNPSLENYDIADENINVEESLQFPLSPRSMQSEPLPMQNVYGIDDEVQEGRSLDTDQIYEHQTADYDDSFRVMGNWGNATDVIDDSDSACSLSLEMVPQ
jgi:hypothetical protein